MENPKLAALDYREEYGVYQLVSLDKNIKPDTIGRKVMEYAQKGDRRLYSVNELGRKTEYKYNEMGQLVELVSNGEKETVFKYDNRGRVSETEDVLGRTYRKVYGEDSRLSKLIQPDGTQSDFDYDRFGHLIKREGAGAYPLSYNYTSFGEIASYRDAQGAETKFFYDKHGKMTSRIWPDGSATVYKYGKNGLLEVKEEAGRVTGYVYNDMNRLVKTQTVYESEASFTEMSYDKDGHLIKVSDGKTSIEYSYDRYGRVIVEDGPVGIIRYVYNAEGLLFAKSCEFKENPGQFLTKYYYDEFSRINKVESQAGVYTYNYDVKGRISTLSMGDKVKIDYAYDKADRLISKKMGDTLLCSYEYDKLNRRVKAEVNGIKWDYGYDIYNQLTSAKADDGKTYSYEYDKIGNRLKLNQTAMVYNKLNQISINGYQYDKWGNLIRTPDSSYKYDLNNRLIEVKKNEVTVKYSYDPLGQRIEAVENIKGQEKTTKYLMSGMVEQARISGGVAQYHTLGLDLANSLNRTGGVGAVLATTSNNTSFNYLYDGNGNVISACNNEGNISEKLNYSPFGELISGKTDIPFTFSTKAIDASGLSYYGFRFYNVELGRWITRDVIRESGGVNLYAFIQNSSPNRFDLLGAACCGATKLQNGEGCCTSITGKEVIFKEQEKCCDTKNHILINRRDLDDCVNSYNKCISDTLRSILSSAGYTIGPSAFDVLLTTIVGYGAGAITTAFELGSVTGPIGAAIGVGVGTISGLISLGVDIYAWHTYAVDCSNTYKTCESCSK